MTSLTKSERIAYRWLEEHGFQDIERRGRNGAPDFIADGIGVEVKKTHGSGTKQIQLTPDQVSVFEDSEDPYILITNDEEVLDILLYSDVKEADQYTISRLDILIESKSRKNYFIHKRVTNHDK